MAQNLLRPQYHFRDFMKFIVVFSLVLALFAWSGVAISPDDEWPQSLLMPFAMALAVAVSLVRPRPRPAHSCVLCGQRYFPFPRADTAGKCPACRMAALPRSARRRLEWRSFAVLAFLILMLAVALVWPFSGLIQGRLGGNKWVVVPLVTLGLALVLFGLLVMNLVLRQLVKRYRISRPGRALSMARVCSGDEGEPEPFGPATAWGFGAKAPTALLSREMGIALKRFEAIVGEPWEPERPLDVFLFAKRAPYETFVRRTMFVSGANHDGIFIPWRTLTVVCATDRPADRLTGVDRVLRTVFAYYALFSYKNMVVPPWLQIGIANVVACGGEIAEKQGLNRAMMAAIARDELADVADLFDPNPKALSAFLRNDTDHESFRRYHQFMAQSWSLIEFLSGAESSPSQRERFRTFLKAIRAGERVAITFERQFGFGFDALLSEWRSWVLTRGLGVPVPPPRHVQDALFDRVIPLLRDPSAAVSSRVRAVREMGRAGYACGSHELIDRLRDPDDLPRAEIVWALESVSGLALGDDYHRWEQWWSGLNPEATVHAVALGGEDEWSADE